MAITKTDHIPNHRPDSSRFDEVVASLVPNLRARIVVCKPVTKNRLDVLFDLVPDFGMSIALAKISCLLLDLLHLTFYVIFLPVVTNYTLQRVSVLDPFNQAGVTTKWHDCVSSKFQIAIARLRVIHQHLIAKAGEVDESLLFAQISVLVTLQQEVVNTLVSAKNANLLWLFFA